MLGIEINQFDVSLSSDLSESDSVYRKDIRYTVPDSVKPGVYQVELTAFNQNDYQAYQVADVTVKACVPDQTQTGTTQPTTTLPPSTQPPVFAQTTAGSSTTSTSGISGNTPMILLLVGVNAILLIAVVAVIARLMQR